MLAPAVYALASAAVMLADAGAHAVLASAALADMLADAVAPAVLAPGVGVYRLSITAASHICLETPS